MITWPRAALLSGFLAAYWASGGAFVLALVCSLIGYAAAGGWRFLRAAWLTFPRDWRILVLFLRARLMLCCMAAKGIGVAHLIAQTMARRPEAVCFVFEDHEASCTSWTFRQVDEYSNRVANLLTVADHRPGRVVAIFAESRPEYPCLCLGMLKVGVVAALVNCNLRGNSLVHSLRAADAVSLVFGAELAPAVQEVAASLVGVRLYCVGAGAGGSDSGEVEPNACCCGVRGAANLDRALLVGGAASSGILPPVRLHRPVNLREKLIYVYTSGTTGLPKAAVISHTRFLMMTYTVGLVFNIGPKDVLYNSLPLYHSSGGIVGVGQAFLYGVTVVIRRKFSAEAFWDDCIKHRCTIAQYIGEICRYLLAQPNRPDDRRHAVRLMFGNGLRPQIWREFQRRFGVRQIGEFYGATESNCNIVNIDNRVGAVGFVSVILPNAFPLRLVRVGRDTGEPLRGSDGRCVRVAPGEPGEIIGSIVRGDALRDFDGYVSQVATETSILRNVFRRGDAYFASGDLLSMDELGYMYFVDRTGDTFRWMGENVSTAEVEACLSNLLGLADCAVYGVELPGCEGRAGMAAIADSGGVGCGVDLDLLARELPRQLPDYARPLFLRLARRLDATGTFKVMKTGLRRDGFCPDRCGEDPLFYRDSRTGAYLAMTGEVFAAIRRGELRF